MVTYFRYTCTFIFICFASFAVAQVQGKFLPSVVVLYPSAIKADSTSASELKSFEKQETITDAFRQEYVRPGLPPNWKTIREKELLFIDQQDFYSLLELTITRELTYREMENRTNLLIYPSKDKSVADLVAFKKMADQHQVSWVLSITKVETTLQNSIRKLIVNVQLYNVITHRIYLTQVYTQSSESITDSSACESVWMCLIESIKDPIVTDVADRIEKNIRHYR